MLPPQKPLPHHERFSRRSCSERHHTRVPFCIPSSICSHKHSPSAKCKNSHIYIEWVHGGFNRVFLFLPSLAYKTQVLYGVRLFRREREHFAVVGKSLQIFYSVLYCVVFLLSITQKLQQIDSFTAPQSQNVLELRAQCLPNFIINSNNSLI